MSFDLFNLNVLINSNWFTGGEEMSLCGAGRLHCYREAEDELLRRSTMEECNCLPACTSTDYNVEISEREFDEFNRINADMNYQRCSLISNNLTISFINLLIYSLDVTKTK